MKYRFGNFLLWHKILLFLSAAISILTLGIAFVIWNTLDEAEKVMGRESDSILSRQTENFIEKIVLGQVNTLDVQLQQVISLVSYAAFYLEEYYLHCEPAENFPDNLLPSLFRGTDTCSMLWYASLSGEMKLYPPANDIYKKIPDDFQIFSTAFFPDTKEWKNGEIRWSRVHVNPFSETYDMVIDAVSPVYSGDILRGYAGACMCLNRLISQFNHFQAIRSSYTFLMDSRFHLIGASPHARVELSSPHLYKPRDTILLRPAANPELDTVLERMALGESSIRQITLGGQEKYIVYHSLHMINWRFALVVPVEMATAASAQLVRVVEDGTRQALERMLYWAAVLLLLTLLTGFLLARQITAPVRELSDATRDIAKGNFSGRVKVRGRDEMSILGHAFNAMTDRIEIMIADLNRINEELSSKNLELEESEERYRLLVETMNEGLGVLDEKNVMTYVNEKICMMLGYSREEILGSQISRFFDSQNRQIHENEMGKRKKGESASYEIQWTRKNGEALPTIISPVPIFDARGNFKGSFGVITDIRKLKHTEEALRKSEERFRSLSENSPDIIFTLSRDRRFTYLNPAFELILGYQRKDMMGRYFRDIVRADDREHCRRQLLRITGKKETVRDMDIRLLHRDRSLRVFHLSGAPNINSAGEVAGIVGICKDITEHRRLEKQLQQALKMEAIGTLAGGIAHDFNNLLTGILGNASLMLLDTEETDSHYQKLKYIEEYARSGAGLTRQLLGFARGGKYEIRVTDINQLIRKSAEMFGRTRKQIQIHYELGKNIAYVEADRGQLEQVMLNIYVNACHAMPEGGDIFLRTENIILDETDRIKNRMTQNSGMLPPGSYARISVTDTGMGMDADVCKRVFEPFFTTKKMGRGTGLGLASAYGIIKNHGGHIQVYSEKGKGSTFVILLPFSRKHQKEEEIRNCAPARSGTETLLLVDDEEMIIEVGQQLLRGLGYRVFTAGKGAEAVEIYSKRQHEISMIILDMIMPEMSGEKVFGRLQEINPDVKVLLSSGYSIDGKAARIMEKGCRGFIQKPFTLKQLSEKVREVLES